MVQGWGLKVRSPLFEPHFLFFPEQISSFQMSDPACADVPTLHKGEQEPQEPPELLGQTRKLLHSIYPPVPVLTTDEDHKVLSSLLG